MQVFAKGNMKWLFWGLTLSFCSVVHANFVGDLGNTQLQKDTGDAVLDTCQGFVAVETTPGTVPLFETCSAMVGTARDIDLGNSNISQDQYAESLQQIASEEFAATQSMANEISNNQLNSSLTRLAELRSGASGFSVAGLFPSLNTHFSDNRSAQSYKAITGTGGSAGDDWSKLGGFLNASYGDGDRDSTSRTNGFDYNSVSISGGVDYRYTSNLVFGVALNYHDIGSDFDKTSTVAGGGVDSDGWGASVYGTYYTDNAYIDGMIGYGASDYDTRRKIIIPFLAVNETAKGSTDSKDFTASIGAGYDIVNQSLTYGPYARLSYLSVDVDGYSEKGADSSGLNLRVDDQKWKSLTSVLGAKFSYTMSQSFGVLIPQGNIGWVHEFKNDAENFTATYVADPRQNILKASTNSPDRNYFELGLGLSAVLKNGIQVYASYDTILGFDDLSQHLLSVGGRWEF